MHRWTRKRQIGVVSATHSRTTRIWAVDAGASTHGGTGRGLRRTMQRLTRCARVGQQTLPGCRHPRRRERGQPPVLQCLHPGRELLRCCDHPDHRGRRHPRRVQHSHQYRRPRPWIHRCQDCGRGVRAIGQRVLGEFERRHRRRLGTVGGLGDACQMTRQIAVALRPGTRAVVASRRIRRQVRSIGVVRPGVERTASCDVKTHRFQCLNAHDPPNPADFVQTTDVRIICQELYRKSLAGYDPSSQSCGGSAGCQRAATTPQDRDRPGVPERPTGRNSSDELRPRSSRTDCRRARTPGVQGSVLRNVKSVRL